MTALDELDLSEARDIATSDRTRGLAEGVVDTLIRAAIADAVWRWWHANQERRIKIRVWFLRPSVRVSELRTVIEWLVGPDPTNAYGWEG